MQKDIEKSKAEGKLDEERNTIIRLNESNASLDFNSSLDESAVKKLREEYSR